MHRDTLGTRGAKAGASFCFADSDETGSNSVAATSATIWTRFIKPLQIYLNMRTSSDGQAGGRGGGMKIVGLFYLCDSQMNIKPVRRVL